MLFIILHLIYVGFGKINAESQDVAICDETAENQQGNISPDSTGSLLNKVNDTVGQAVIFKVFLHGIRHLLQRAALIAKLYQTCSSKKSSTLSLSH